MRIYDITVPIGPDVPIYDGDPKAAVESHMRMDAGDVANVTQLCFGAHTGTHVDAPNHFIPGTRRVDDLDLGKLIGPCLVVEIAQDVDAIEVHHLPDLDGVKRLLFKTKNSAFWDHPEHGFRTDFTFITESAAHRLADSGLDLVGIDYLSVERFGSKDFAAHKAMLAKEMVLIEGVDLRAVPAGEYELICLPLKYKGGEGDGSPARTVLRTITNEG